MNRRRSDGSPLTSARSSGANSTVRNRPRASRGRGTGERFTLARLARPGLISISTSARRSSLTTAARTIARCAPCRTSGASVATRWLEWVAT